MILDEGLQVNRSKRVGVAVVLMLGVGAAHAQSGKWAGKVGYNEFYPQVSSGEITGVLGSAVDVRRGGGIFGSAVYSFDEHLSAELAFGVPPRLDISGDGIVAAAGKIADTKIYAPILLVQYRFFSGSAFRPYVGLGATYAKFSSVRTTPVLAVLMNQGRDVSASIDNKWGVSGQVGVTYDLSPSWFFDGSIVAMRVKTTARLSTGQSVNVSVDPLAVNAAIGYRF
jgi:outer membrane protein